MSGWVPFDADSWPELADFLAELGRPWPASAAAFDLRWHADREIKHGRPFWGRRWSWDDWKVRVLLRSEVWKDPIHQPASSDPPEALQPASSSPPTGTQANAGSPRKSSSRPPAPLQKSSSSPPEVLHTRGDPPSPSQPPSPSPNNTPSPAAADLLFDADEEHESNGVPKWAKVKGYDSRVILAAVTRALSAIRGTLVNPERSATDAKHVISLQRITATPWPELAEQLELVAEWARDSDDHLASNDIRGMRPDGQTWGPDRSRSVSTICVHGRWSDRLAAAERWRNGEHLRPRARGEHPSQRKPQPTTEELHRLHPDLMDPL